MTKLICAAAPMLLAFSLTAFMPVAAHAQAAKTAAK